MPYQVIHMLSPDCSWAKGVMMVVVVVVVTTGKLIN